MMCSGNSWDCGLSVFTHIFWKVLLKVWINRRGGHSRLNLFQTGNQYRCFSHLQVLDVNAHPVRHGEEALELRLIQKEVDHHPPQSRIDDLFKNVHVGEDVHRYGNKLETHRKQEEGSGWWFRSWFSVQMTSSQRWSRCWTFTLWFYCNAALFRSICFHSFSSWALVHILENVNVIC